MLTRCPKCDTAFRVTPEQLKARQGRVRCGQCQAVFNALDTLGDETVVLGPPGLASEAAVPEPMPSFDAAQPAAQPADETATEAVADIADAPEDAGSDGASSPAPDAEPATPAAPAPAVPAEEAGDTMTANPAEAPAPAPQEPLLYQEQLPTQRAWPWALGILTGLLALTLQAALAFRIELVVLAPEARPLLVSLCELAGCELGLPSRIDLIGLESSDLRPDPAQPGRLQLEAGLRNRAPFVQTWPHLELTLTDTNDQAVIRRILPPREYLPEGVAPATGFAAGGEQAVRLALETDGVAAAGYRLYIFYP